MSEKNNPEVYFFRSPHDGMNPYAQISRSMLHDRNLSLKAKGLLSYLLSLPGDWKIYHSQLMQALNCGESCLNSGFEELIQQGYARRERSRSSKGTFNPYRYEISEFKKFQPDGIIQPGLSRPENPVLLKKEEQKKYKQTTTTTKEEQQVVVVVSSKIEENTAINKMHGYLQDVAKHNGSAWDIPVDVLRFLVIAYGGKYVADQLVYITKRHAEALRDEKIPNKRKKVERIEKPETYLKLACEKNYATSSNKKKE